MNLKDSEQKRIHGKILASLIAFISFTTVFILIIRSIDIVNVRQFLYSSSFVWLSQNPYFKGQNYGIATPPVFFSILLPNFYFYQSTWNFEVSSSFLRVLNLFFSVLSSLLIYKIVKSATGDESKSYIAYLALLVSPAFFFVNFIFNEQSIYGICLTLASFYLLFFNRENSSLRTFSGSLLLVFSTFLYYFPGLIILPLLVFSTGLRDFLTKFGFIALSFISVLLAFHYAIDYSIFQSGMASASNSSFIPISSILAVLTKGVISQPYSQNLLIVQTIFNILFFVLALTLPILLRLAGFDIYRVLLSVYVIPFLFLRIFAWDEFLWIFPFLLLLIANHPGRSMQRVKMLLLQAYYIPILILFNMWSAPSYGQGTGIFYLTYLQFHNSTTIHRLITNPIVITSIFDILNYALLVIILLLALLSDRNEPPDKVHEEFSNFEKKLKTATSEIRRFIGTSINDLKSLELKQEIAKRLKSTTSIAVATFLVMILFILAPINLTQNPSTIEYTGGKFPIGLFASNSYLMNSTLTYNYTNDGHGITFSNYSGNLVPPTYFVRSIDGEFLSTLMSFKVNIPSNELRTFPLVGFDGANMTYGSYISIKGNYQNVSVRKSGNLTVGSPSYSILTDNKEVTTFYSYGNGTLTYFAPFVPGLNSDYIFAFRIDSFSFLHNQIFFAESGNLSLLLYYPNENESMLGIGHGDIWKFNTIDSVSDPQAWNYADFQYSKSLLTVALDGINITTQTLHQINPTMNITMGCPLGPKSNKTGFKGALTPLMSVGASLKSVNRYLAVRIGDNLSPIWNYNGSILSITRNATGIEFGYSNDTYFHSGVFNTFWFGRLSKYVPSIVYTLIHLQIENNTTKLRLQLVTVLFGIPVFLGSALLADFEMIRRSKKKRGKS